MFHILEKLLAFDTSSVTVHSENQTRLPANTKLNGHKMSLKAAEKLIEKREKTRSEEIEVVEIKDRDRASRSESLS